jgi:aconitate hydratase
MYLGVQAVIVKSFARIHKANLVNVGILPLEFADPADYGRLRQGDRLEIRGVRAALESGHPLTVRNETQGTEFQVRYDLSQRQVEVVLAGGVLNLIKQQA